METKIGNRKAERSAQATPTCDAEILGFDASINELLFNTVAASFHTEPINQLRNVNVQKKARPINQQLCPCQAPLQPRVVVTRTMEITIQSRCVIYGKHELRLVK